LNVEIGVLFSIDGLGRGFYSYQAWKIFMHHCQGERLAASVLFEGDTKETLNGQGDEFCISVGASREPTIQYVKEVLSKANDKGLMPVEDRFLEGNVTRWSGGNQPLVLRARVDYRGRFVSKKWSGIDEKLCEEAGWIYVPESVK
jgi:hypothetical protein